MLNLTPFQLNQKSGLYENTYLEEVIQLHTEHYQFTRRKVNIFIIEQLTTAFPVSKSLSFVCINFIYLVFSGVFLFKITQLLYEKTQISLLALILYYTNFSILFSFFPPVYTFDDLLQYTLVFLSAFYLIKKKIILFALIFLLSVLTRESSLFLIPILYGYLIYTKQNYLLTQYSIVILFVFIAYIFYLFLLSEIQIQYIDTFQRLEKYILENFQDFQHSIESIFSWLSLFALPLYLCVFQVKQATMNEKKVIILFWLVVLFNTILMLFTCIVRETRLYNIPLILFLPFYGNLLLKEVYFIRQKLKQNHISILSFANIFFIPLAYYLSKIVYKTSIGITSELFFNAYYFILFCIVLNLLFFRFITINPFLMRKRKQRSK